jgi:hypothetical protein
MTKLGDLYTDFARIDLDTRGGYARVSQVKTHGRKNLPEFCALKLMRHENDYNKGIERFEEEIKLMTNITRDPSAPTAITRIYDSGFVPIELSDSLHKRKLPNPKLEIISTGLRVQDFIEQKDKLQNNIHNQWIPYLVVELAPYDGSLLRQIHNQPQEDPSGLFRLPTGEVIVMAIQLLEVMQYLHTKHHRAYMDWKPEHIHWDGVNKQIKLIDWNVTSALNDGPGEKQNIKDDLRLFCGAVLYIGLTFVDPDDPTNPIGPRPTKEMDSPVPEIRRRYWTDKPNFYQRSLFLDDEIQGIVSKGLDPKHGYESIQNLKAVLINYAKKTFGASESEFLPKSVSMSSYFKSIAEVRTAQQELFQAQQYIIDAIRDNGSTPEFTRLFNAIKHALKNFPTS